MSSQNTEPIVQYGGRLVLDSDESEDDDDGMPNKISKSQGPKKGFSGNKSIFNWKEPTTVTKQLEDVPPLFFFKTYFFA